MGAFEAGAKATVCGVGNIYPELLQKMYQSFIAGNKEEAMELQRLILKIRNITKYGPTVPIMYEILKMRGIDAGYPRLPYIDIDEELKERTKKGLQELGLL
jgi:dihydrodipicolinate synthase/N-acetylneuraminate lyase